MTRRRVKPSPLPRSQHATSVAGCLTFTAGIGLLAVVGFGVLSTVLQWIGSVRGAPSPVTVPPSVQAATRRATTTLSPTASTEILFSTDVPVLPICDCSSNLYDCADFDTPQEAQACFTLCRDDIHLLDADGNGIVCEVTWGNWATASVPPTRTSAPQPTQPQSEPPITCARRTCGSFGSCGSVTAYLNACPQYRNSLDRDGDGVPCELLCG